MRLLLWLWLGVLGLCAGQVMAQAPVRSYDSIAESGVLKVMLYQDFAPYSFVADGQPRGVDYELAQALAKGLGLTLEVIWAVPGEKLDDDLRDYIWRGHYLRPHELADVMMRVPYD
ncbi:MAG: transporter substrate-binding domain-containing protein, partial [Pseudomonas sp.]|uniref:transporter substrate-binding domain-containing protein n=1 Tax=Pseudomonas sp. TaxID=306 RepID=UPI003BB4FF9A